MFPEIQLCEAGVIKYEMSLALVSAPWPVMFMSFTVLLQDSHFSNSECIFEQWVLISSQKLQN